VLSGEGTTIVVLFGGHKLGEVPPQYAPFVRNHGFGGGTLASLSSDPLAAAFFPAG
jgi:hypothetical protein